MELITDHLVWGALFYKNLKGTLTINNVEEYSETFFQLIPQYSFKVQGSLKALIVKRHFFNSTKLNFVGYNSNFFFFNENWFIWLFSKSFIFTYFPGLCVIQVKPDGTTCSQVFYCHSTDIRANARKRKKVK